MSCWVVPTIAAELWGLPVDDIYSRIHSGALPARYDCGFTLVDVAPGSGQISAAPAAPRPATPPKPAPPATATIRFVGRQPARKRRRRPPSAGTTTLGLTMQAAPAFESSPAVLPEPVSVSHPASQQAVEPIFSGDPTEAELAALGFGPAVEPAKPLAMVATAEVLALASADQPVQLTAERAVDIAAVASEPDVEDEAGPDPNFGEPDDGKPLDWRRTRERVASTRRRPPPRF